MSVYIFLGPSLAASRAKEILPAHYLPPVQQGDVLRVLAARPEVIGIIDGYFETTPSVWHKEILLALAEGVHVFGASSMGALRAAELHPFGMVGVGKIFVWYRDGEATGDDEVAVAHAAEDFGYRRLSDAHVDIRDACEAAAARGLIPHELAERLAAISKRTYFAERTYREVARLAADEGADRRHLAAWLEFVRQRPGLKERDAVEMLCRVRDFTASRPGPFRADFTLERTEFLERFRNEVELSRVTRMARPPDDEHEVLRACDTLSGLRDKQLLRLLARQEAERLGWQLTDEEVQEMAEAFRERHGLTETGKMLAWMDAEGLSETAFWQFINDACLVDRLKRLYGHAIERALPDQLRIATASLCAAAAEETNGPTTA